jgi:signal transduction histidine kinase
VNPPSTPTLEPIYSLPIGAAAGGLLLIVGAMVLLGLLLARRSQGRETVPDVKAVPWLASLLDGLPQAALVVDALGQTVAWNTAAARTLALADQARSLPMSLAGLVARVLDAGSAETTEITAPGAPDRRLRATASPLRAMDFPSGALVLLQDPTGADRSTESYRRLISAMAHELRTPLTAILGHADILDSCKLEEDEALWRRSRDFIASEAERLARLVEDLLTLSRLDLTPLQRRPVNLRVVAEEAISGLFQAAETRGVRLALQSPPDLPRVLGDRDRLQQVFLNLLDNAVKYSSGSEAVVCLSPESSFIQTEVRDDGVGIAPEDLPHIFEPLYRSEDVRDISGTGLGLTIVRTILAQHGTTIDVQSAPHQGTAFRFRLPFAQSSQASPSSPS